MERRPDHHAPAGERIESADQAVLVRERDAPPSCGGRIVQSAPLLFTREGHALYLGDQYRGRGAFLIAGGPSFGGIDSDLLRRAGCLTMGLNNSPKTFRPDLWICVDNPPRFMKSIWLDPRITKFVPYCFAEHRIFDNETWKITETSTGDCPNVLFYRRNARFDATKFLFEGTVNWGDSNDHGGHRSVLLAALRILFFLGIRDIYLLGVDFRMSAEEKYHFEEGRAPKSIEWNNKTYQSLIEKFTLLRPEFEAAGFRVWNCNPDSALKVFPFLDVAEAVARCTAEMPADLATERTEGLYERDPLQRLSPPRLVKPEEATTGHDETTRHDGRAGVVVGCDAAAEWMLPWWLDHYRAHNDFPVTFVDFGMSADSRAWCQARGRLVDLPAGLPKMKKAWFYKAWMFRLCDCDQIVGLDLDCEVRGSLQPVFDLIGERFVLGPDHPIGEYEKVFLPGLYFNSGVVGVSRHNPLLERWEEETLAKHPHFRGDQEILNFVLYSGGVEVVALPERFNCLRLHGNPADAVVMHWTGPQGKETIRAAIENQRPSESLAPPPPGTIRCTPIQ